MSFPRYPAYKDSGVAWLGEVPDHWSVCAVRRAVARIEQGWSPECEATPADDDAWGVLKAGCLNNGIFDASENKALPLRLAPMPEYEVGPGDVLMSRASGSPELVGSVALVKETRPKLMLSDKIFRIRLTSEINPAHFVWSMSSRPIRSQIEQALSGGNGLANNLPQSVLLAFQLALPPAYEQDVIASFIDRETAKIDALVAEQEQLITLLKEKRQAVISHAVTKGLDPSVPTKDSGVEWLGEVPAHWTITPIKHLGRLKGGAGFPHSEQGVEGEELCFYKVGALGQSSSNGYLTESENTVSRETACALGAFIFPKESLVFAKVGAALFLGRVRALPADACLDNNMMGLVVDQERNSPAFVRYAMSLVRFDLIANPGAVPSLNEGQIGNFVLVCPPSKVEQGEIAAFLDRATVQLEDLLAQAETVIATLQERRSALISAAVTGQIDVRGLAAAQEQAA